MYPNVVILVLDSARRDAFEPYGAPSGSSPAIAQLAGRGVALEDVYATGCWTVPSHASIFTGLLPRAAGLPRAASPSAAKPVLEGHRDRLLPEVMRRAGYWTAGVSANLWVSEISGFGTGFEDFVQVDTDRQGQIQSDSLKGRLRWIAEAARGRVDDGADEIESTLEQWINRARTERRPFFWFANMMESHSPYLPPRPYGDISVLDRFRAAEDARRYYTLVAIWQACSGVRPVPEPALERMRRLYRASVLYLDDCVGRLVERLDGAGMLDDTLVVVMADHGENLGEQGLIAHALSLDNRLIHVPFVAAGPGASGATINSLAHLPRFVAGAAGLAEHPWTDGPPPGIGVAQLDPPLDRDDPSAMEKLERAGLTGAYDLFTTPVECAARGGLKLLRRGETEQAYDLSADAGEAEPRDPRTLPDRHEELAVLRDALAHPSMTTRAVAADSTASADPPSPEELQELEERMRLLGYM